MEPQVLNIDSEPLAEFKNMMNFAIETLIIQLTDKNLKAGEVTGKIKISLEKRADKETGLIYYMPVIEPDVGMKIGAKAKLDCEKKAGMILQKGPGGTPVVATNQITMDEMLGALKGA